MRGKLHLWIREGKNEEMNFYSQREASGKGGNKRKCICTCNCTGFLVILLVIKKIRIFQQKQLRIISSC